MLTLTSSSPPFLKKQNNTTWLYQSHVQYLQHNFIIISLHKHMHTHTPEIALEIQKGKAHFVKVNANFLAIFFFFFFFRGNYRQNRLMKNDSVWLMKHTEERTQYLTVCKVNCIKMFLHGTLILTASHCHMCMIACVCIIHNQKPQSVLLVLLLNVSHNWRNNVKLLQWATFPTSCTAQ